MYYKLVPILSVLFKALIKLFCFLVSLQRLQVLVQTYPLLLSKLPSNILEPDCSLNKTSGLQGTL